ncbi:hypothetical protein [Verrucosispora sp. WMMD573]|uniref:hypothetical protein n=1 Tax=Verrucosispora sp. WMMD573 TaxID=3015149 RepID=UPI00248CCD23|nr:hypothetical protein [Verrucosispora sp. WMMD573]WBB57649.1 hypothetical protein O7601_22655 [Verrucosispora sp. WMMD573]
MKLQFGREVKPANETKQRLYGGNREYHLRRRYGTGQQEFDELLAEQGGVCAVCDDPRSGTCGPRSSHRVGARDTLLQLQRWSWPVP